MLNGGDHRFRDTVASALSWWAEAGVDSFVDEPVRNWLTPPSKPRQPVSIAAPEPSADLPDTIEALHALLATGVYAPQPAPPGRRVAPVRPGPQPL